MSEDWRTQGEPQTVKVEAPESSAAATAAATAEAPAEVLARGAGIQRKDVSFDIPEKPRPPRIAVLALHGMGQQIPFETVDQVQRNFCAAASRRGVDLPNPSVRVAKVGGEVLRRAEIPLREGPDAPEVHFYEAYWAPLTEGRVTLRDVISFLRTGGSNGLRHSLSLTRSWRFMFDRRFPFPRSLSKAFNLSLALLSVSSLVILNAIIVAVAAGTNWLPSPPGWLKGEFLKDDLTGVASLVCLIGAALGAGLFLGMTRRDLSTEKPWRLPEVQRMLLDFLFYLTLIVLIVSAGVIVWLVRQHVRTPPQNSVSFLNPLLGGDLKARQLAAIITTSIALIALIAVLGLLIRMIFRKKLAPVARVLVSGGFFAAVAVAGVAGAYVLALRLDLDVRTLPGDLPWPFDWFFDNRRLWIWTVLIGLSAMARNFLIQYLGDVALYVSPHKLDRFNEVRERIRNEVFKTACALYAAQTPDGKPEYDQVALVGHSLGSVVAYDTLNYLIDKDLLSEKPLGVNTRTCLLLTFGSPLDKIAYLFQIQGTRTSDTREALANAVQPLIRSYDYRKFKWINVYSEDDIISGSLELFDDESSGGEYRVQNKEDRYSSIPLVAHTEYWRTEMVWDELYEQVAAYVEVGKGGPERSALGIDQQHPQE